LRRRASNRNDERPGPQSASGRTVAKPRQQRARDRAAETAPSRVVIGSVEPEVSAHVFRLRRRIRTERDFDYFL
jgi:hypothetical protein